MEKTIQVAGVDGCSNGWFITFAEAQRSLDKQLSLEILKFSVTPDFAEVLSQTINCELICIDVPIGLSDKKQSRLCDIEARRVLGWPRSSSIFPVPIRGCLAAKNYKQAVQITREICRQGLSKQTFMILDKIREVDEKMTPELQNRVREIHPEVCFWALNGFVPMRHNKKKRPGRGERIELLETVFANMREIFTMTSEAGLAEPDDVLDSIVAAWTASQEVVLGNARTLPENPHVDSKGLRMEIVYPA